MFMRTVMLCGVFSHPDSIAMAEMGTQAMREALEAADYRVEFSDTGRIGSQQYICYLKCGSSGRGYFGATDAAALEKTTGAIRDGDKIGW